MRSLLAAGLALLAMGLAAPSASAAPWACDNAGYLTQFDGANPAFGTVLNRADRQPNGTYQPNPLGREAAEHINALAFRPQDGLLYAFNNTTQEVTRIERDPLTGVPTFDDIGNPPGSGITITVIGAVLADGTYLVWDTTGTDHGAIFDVSGPTAQLVTTVTLDPASPAGFRGDFAISPVDGQIYGVSPDNPADPNSAWGVYRFALNGSVLTRGARVAAGSQAGGGAWFQPDGTFIMYANGTAGTPPQGNGVYGINLTTGQMSFLGAGPAFSNADGAACANGIALTKDATPRTVTAGQEITYTHTMTSRALQDASIDFSDELPAGMTYVPGGVTVSPQIGTPNNYGGTGALTVSGTIAPQQTVTITARVLVSPDHPCNVDVENQSQATLTVPGSPPVMADSDDQSTPNDPDDPTIVHVNCSADVGIVKTATTSPLVPGEEATFTMVATNNGPSTARNVRVSDQLPAEFSFRSAGPECAEAGGTLTCTVASLAPGASQTHTVTGLVASGLSECLENTATVISDTPDPNPGNNSSTVCPPPKGNSDLSLRKDASSATVAPGGQVMYTLVVKNNGPSDNKRAQVSDPLAAGLALVAAKPSQGTCTTADNAVACDLGRLKAGGSAQVLVTVNVTATSGCITNTARVQGAVEDPTPENNQDSAEICIDPPPPSTFDLVVTKTAGDRDVLVGQRVTYRVVVRNNGPDAATNTVVPDTLNAPVRVVSARSTQGSCERRIPMRCELGRIEAGQSATITIVAKHRKATGCSPRQRNAASAVATGTDSNPANNMDTVDVCVRKVSVKVSKVASRSTVSAGETFGYRIRVRNPTKGEARNVKVCDRLPSGLLYVSSAPRAKRQGSQRCWTIKTLSAGKSRTFKVTVRAARGTSGRKTNIATVNSPDTRPARARDRVRVLGVATPVTG